MDTDLLKLLGGGGLAGALLALIYLVGTRLIASQDKTTDRLVAAIERIAIKLDDHTKSDVDAQGEVRDAIVRVEAKLDERRSTPVQGVPIMTTYGPQRAGTKGGG